MVGQGRTARAELQQCLFSAPFGNLRTVCAGWMVNRLKLLKRAMYGRAKLDLLRRRFLLAA